MSQNEDPILELIQFEHVIKTREEKITIGRGTRIDSFVKLEGGEGLIIGQYVHIASFCHIGLGRGLTVIEDYCNLSSGAKLIAGSNQVDFMSISVVSPGHLQRVKSSFVSMERYSAVFTNGVVLPGVTLHEGAVLAAGSVATRDIPAWEIWAGVPARFLKKRVLAQ